MTRIYAVLASFCALIAGHASAAAFCGFYVSGADAELYNNATMVVMMRAGTRTVLSMQNDYQGPPEDFAMVVPVPMVLQEENVKTLPRSIFDRVDKLAAPRLVEYWEQDPCAPQLVYEEAMPMAAVQKSAGTRGAADLGVTIEAQFEVGEYQIVVLGAKESTGLETWLKQESYNIPDNAAPLFRPYIENGWKFFVAKVDTEKVTFEDGRAVLSPLRFHYDDDEFRLPVRLGLINSSGTQDLLVHILARGQRYEVANFDNVTIPTNIEVANDVREQFGGFYTALFDATLEKNPGAVVTEYAWDASTCDPCPEPALTQQELATLGADVAMAPPDPKAPQRPQFVPMDFVLTRLHARYDADSLGEDLVFGAASPIAGGRELTRDGALEQGAVEAGRNNFQGRYIIRHRWAGPIECEEPVRGRWGGPPQGGDQPTTRAAEDLGFAPRGQVTLAKVVKQDIPEIGVAMGKAAEPAPAEPAAPDTPAAKNKKGCSGCATGAGDGGGWLVLLAVAAVWRRRR